MLNLNFPMSVSIVSNDTSILVFGGQPIKHSTLQLINNSLIQKFHQEIRQVAKSGEQISELGRFTSSSVANVELPFTSTDGPTYEAKGAKSVCVQGGTSGLDKRQCTVQLTLFADGIP